MTIENYSIEFLCTVLKELTKLPKEIQQQITTKIDELKSNPYPVVVKALKNGDGWLRLRVGDYRVIYRVESD